MGLPFKDIVVASPATSPDCFTRRLARNDARVVASLGDALVKMEDETKIVCQAIMGNSGRSCNAKEPNL